MKLIDKAVKKIISCSLINGRYKMANKEDLYKQNLQDMLRVCVVMGQILDELEIPEEQAEKVQERINYCTKNLNTVTEKLLFLNKQK